MLLLLAWKVWAAPTPVDLATLATFEGTSTSNTPGVDQGTMAFGDFNCDGVEDLVLGTPAYATYKGRIYVKFGGSVSGATALSYTTMSWTVIGETAYRSLGTHVHATDVDGDGCDDILAAGSDTATGYAKIYTFLGGASRGAFDSVGAYYTLNSTITADYNLSATVSVGTYGHLLGELDGPGSGDHLALCSDVSGKCYLIPVANLVNTTSTIEDEASHIVYDNIGSCSIHDALVSADIDGDGNEDLIAGDSGEDQATVFFGPLSTSPSLYPSTSCNGTIGDCFFTNSPAGEDILIADTSTVGFGSTVVAGALLDSDGPADLIIGALDATVDSVTSAGRYDVITGASIAALRDAVTVTTGITIYDDTSTAGRSHLNGPFIRQLP